MKKVSPAGKVLLSTVFCASTCLAIGLDSYGYFLPEDQKDVFTQKTGLQDRDIRALTPAKVRFFSPDDKMTRVFAESINNTSMIEILDSHNNAPATAAFSFKDTLFGHDGVIDKLTLGASGQLYACVLVLSTTSATKDDIKQTLKSIPPEALKNFPGTDSDYMKVIASHELAHCNQNRRVDDRKQMERDADQTSLDYFLKTGGNPDVARSFIYFRTIVSMQDSLFTSGTPQRYTGNPGLISRYFNDSVTITPEIAEKGFLQVGDVMQKYAYDHKINPVILYSAPILNQVINQALNDPDFKPEPEVRAVVKLYQEAYQFFTTPSVPGIS